MKIVLKGVLLRYDWCPHKKRKLETDTHRGRMPYEREDGHRQARKRPGTDSFLIVYRKNQPCQPLDPGLSASRTMRLCTQSVVLCHSSPNKLIQTGGGEELVSLRTWLFPLAAIFWSRSLRSQSCLQGLAGQHHVTTQKSHQGAPTDQRIASKTAKWDSGSGLHRDDRKEGRYGGRAGHVSACSGALCGNSGWL